MKMTLSLAEHDLRDDPAPDRFDILERIARDVLTNGGTFNPTICHDGLTTKQLNTVADFAEWLKGFRVHYGV